MIWGDMTISGWVDIFFTSQGWVLECNYSIGDPRRWVRGLVPQPLVRSPAQPFQAGPEEDPGERQGEARHTAWRVKLRREIVRAQVYCCQYRGV